MATSANVDKETTTKGYFWNIFRLSASLVLFVSLLLVYICTYNNLTSQLQQLRADVDRLKDAQLQLLKLADGDASSTGLEPNRRSKRHHDASNNDSAADNDTSSNENYDDGGSGEVPDRRFDGIWMGTYSRVPMYAIREYCLAMTENCPPPIPGTPGRPGEQGRVGEPGPTGERGVPGTKGERGVVGETGETGMKGDRGEKGEKGHRGRPGLDGLPGNDGINGTDGEKGRRGKRGRHGSPGEKGNKGEQGPEGPPGQLLSDDEMQTIRGPRGVPGPPGLPGPKGDRGDRGDSCGCISTEATTVITTTVEPTIDPRIRDCQIRRIGTPLFYRTMETFWGMWLTDSNPHEQLGQKFWLTKHVSGKQLFYYNNGENVKRDEPDGVYELKELYFGTGNVVYNGSFYYHREGWNEIIRFDLVRNESVAKVQIPFAAYDRREFVYSTEYSYFDLAVDENGLWVIYAAEGDHDFLLVSKLDADDLTIQKTWNITVRHREYGNGLIACGLLYLVKDVQSTSTVIDYAFDLYTKQRLDVRLRFNNPFQMNNMIAFNHAERQIYSWDKGHLLNYPLLLRDRGLY